jgi:hypothetical protein
LFFTATNETREEELAMRLLNSLPDLLSHSPELNVELLIASLSIEYGNLTPVMEKMLRTFLSTQNHMPDLTLRHRTLTLSSLSVEEQRHLSIRVGESLKKSTEHTIAHIPIRAGPFSGNFFTS